MSAPLFGLALLALIALLLAATGLPAFVVLVFASALGAAVAVATGTDSALLGALPGRVLNLLENDLMQALPLYVFMGLALDRMQVPDALFRSALALCPPRARARAAAPASVALGLGALLGPLNGAVGASVIALARSVAPQLQARALPAPLQHAVIALAGTFGVVIPPSLVLILMGEAMLSAHTLAITAAGRMDRAINVQDVMRAALLPAALVLLASLAVTWWQARGAVDADVTDDAARAASPPRRRDRWVALSVLGFLVLLLTGISSGRLRAVEGAALGALTLLTLGLASGALPRRTLHALLQDALATTGALFALLLAATTFTLALRMLGTDRLLAEWIAQLQGGPLTVVAVCLGTMSLTALVLDALEIIFVVVPLVMPPLLTRVADAQWIAALTLLTLQASFLLPPFGYATIVARSALPSKPALRAVLASLAPYLAVQALVFVLVLVFPRLAHLGGPAGAEARAVPAAGALENAMPEPTNEPLPPPEASDFGPAK